MGKNGKAKGIVTGSLVGIASMILYTHEDGSQCPRPGPREIPIGTLIESEFSVESGLCEHFIVSVTEPKPVPVPKVLTVADILQHVEAKKAQPKQPSLALPKEDAPVDEATIARAKVPPRIKSNIATAPAAIQAAAKIPLEEIFDGDLEGYTANELAELRGSRTYEPMNPFDSNFVVERPSAPQVRRGNKPQSVFDR
jgi:hypothetical protein